MTKSNLYPKHPDLWLGRHFHIDAYVSIQEMPDGSGRILIKKPSGQVWGGEVEAQDRLEPDPHPPLKITRRVPRYRARARVWYTLTAVRHDGSHVVVAKVRSEGLTNIVIQALQRAYGYTELIIT